MTWLPDGDAALDSGLCAAYKEILQRLEATGAVVIQERVFCDLSFADTILAARSVKRFAAP